MPGRPKPLARPSSPSDLDIVAGLLSNGQVHPARQAHRSPVPRRRTVFSWGEDDWRGRVRAIDPRDPPAVIAVPCCIEDRTIWPSPLALPPRQLGIESVRQEPLHRVRPLLLGRIAISGGKLDRGGAGVVGRALVGGVRGWGAGIARG